MLVSLDTFADVSVHFERHVSDLLLYEAAARLHAKLRNGDVVTRSGSSQFAVLVGGVEEVVKAERVAGELIERLQRPITVAGTRFRLSASIGITLFPQHGDEWRELLHNADAAACDAKTRGRGRISISAPPPTR